MILKVNKRHSIYKCDIGDSHRTDVIIHKLVGYDDELFITCHELGIDKHNTHITDLNEAIVMAKRLINKKLAELNHMYEDFLYDETQAEIIEE